MPTGCNPSPEITTNQILAAVLCELKQIAAGGGGGGLSPDIIDALEAANAPDAGNPFATMADVAGGGGGDVSGPASSTDNAIVRFNGATGKLVQDSGITIADGATGTLSGSNSGDVTLAGTPNYLTIANQVITRALINLTSHVTGTLPVANGGTGITSLGAGVATFLGTPSSANLAAAVTGETGTGALVFGTSPTIATPTISGAVVFPDNVRQTFDPGTTNAGLNLGAVATAPSSLTNGDLWYDSALNQIMGRENGVTIPVGLRGRVESWEYALSDDGALPTDLSAGVKVNDRAPYAGTLVGVRIHCATAPTGSAVQVNVLVGGTTVFSTRPTIAVGSTTSVGGTPAVISSPTIADNATLVFDVTNAPTTGGGALKIILYVART